MPQPDFHKNTALHPVLTVNESMTDFYYVCYLSDLAVDETYQRQAIGLRLQQLTQKQLQPSL